MKIKIVIGGKVPGKNTQDRQCFWNVKVDWKPLIKYVHKHIVQCQAHYRNKDKFYEEYICVARGLEGPFKIEIKIIDHRAGKAKAIGHILVYFKFLL